MNPSQIEAVPNADAHTSNAALPTYSELVEALRYASKEMQAAEAESPALACTGRLAVSISMTRNLLARIPA